MTILRYVQSALRDGLFTDKKLVPTATRKKLQLFTEKYWGPVE